MTIRSGRRGRRRRRLRRDADADVHRWAGSTSTASRSTTCPTPRRRASSPPVRDPRALRLRHPLGRGRHPPSGVRISPFDNHGRRQTSFAAVEVVPVLEQTDEVEVDENDRASTSSAPACPRWPVGQHHRLRGPPHAHPHRHRRVLPEREVAAAEQGVGDGRPQGQAARQAEGRGGRPQEGAQGRLRAASWATNAQLRAQPLPIVKDLRTGHESGNPSSVFDGDLDDFMEAGIRWRRSVDRDDRDDGAS